MNLEALRLQNLQEKQKLLADLKLEARTSVRSTRRSAGDDDENYEYIEEKENKPRQPAKKKRKINIIPAAPERASARIASSVARPSYKEDGGDRFNYIERAPKSNGKKPSMRGKTAGDDETDSKLVNDQRSLVPIADVDNIVAGWTDWTPVGAPPTRDDHATFHFDDFPTFTPNKSPEEMLREGAFGGSYFRPLKSRRLGIVIEDDWQQLPSSWITDLDVSRYLISPVYEPDANKFKVVCGQSIEEWEAMGWIAHEFDVRGWFQWYCRFWMGRRCDDDVRQVGRWAKCVGARGRWRRLLLKKYVQMGVKDVFDDGDEEDEETGESKQVSPVMHQTCHHWAYEVRQGDLDEAWDEFGR